MTKFLNDERVPREDGGATLHIMFHSFVILLKYEALNEDVLQDGVIIKRSSNAVLWSS